LFLDVDAGDTSGGNDGASDVLRGIHKYDTLPLLKRPLNSPWYTAVSKCGS
jgi:hypothetical protein